MNAILEQEGMDILDRKQAKSGHICDRRNAKWNTKIAKVGVFSLTEGTSLSGVVEQKKSYKTICHESGPKPDMMKI
jgi:hypothetical protein